MTILITGANRGIGAALLNAYAARGPVIGTARRPSDDLWQLDVTDPASINALATRLDGAALSLLVCNAGVNPSGGLGMDDLTPAHWAEGFATNVTGVFLTIRACLPALQRGRGKIAILGSAMGSDQRAPGGEYVYRASKAAVLNLARNLATDLDLPVGTYHPGWVQTDMGGPMAEITVAECVTGLMAQFDALDTASSGCFQDWRGQPVPF